MPNLGFGQGKILTLPGSQTHRPLSMNDKDKQNLEALHAHLMHLQVKCHQQDHELMHLRIHSVEQDSKLKQLLTMLGLVPDDLNAPNALTTITTLLRMRRAEN